VWLDQHIEELSRSRIQDLIKQGHVTLQGRTVKAHQKISEGMIATVNVPPPVETSLVAENIPIDVIYEDTDIIVLNKQPGIVVHPAAGHPRGTLVNALLFHCEDLGTIGGEIRPGIVHRLDRDTSGVMVVAKNDRSLQSLVNQFKACEVSKEYAALVHGQPQPLKGTVETLIGRSTHDRKKMSARPARGREAVTHYEVTETFDEASLLCVRPRTGRTHQIRVHMAHAGHPIVGDGSYGDKREAPTAARQMLHARILAFRHPGSGETVTFNAPLPLDMLELIDKLRDRQRRV
jgi:23S rRNA pseudouridine1911/1915/1917 synthase